MIKGKKIVKSFQFAHNGIEFLVRKENNFRFHLLATFFVSGAGFYFQISKLEWISIIGCIGAVLAMESINTAIEKLVDLVSPDYNKQAGLVKDLAASAVLIVSISSVIIGGLVFWKYLV